MLKKFRAFAIVLCLCLLLSGCSLRLDSIEDLISPISPSGENAEVLKAVEEYCPEGFSLKIPSSGKYKTSFVYYDIDNDDELEAVSFYEPSDKKGIVNMALIKKSSSQWKVVDNIEGDGSDIISIDFCDIDNDRKDEPIVCWSLISKSTNYSLKVYKYSNSDKHHLLKPVSSSITADSFVCADMNDDGVNELVVFKLGSTTFSPRAELYSFSNNSEHLLCETKLDSAIMSFSSIIVGETDQGTSIYADALKSDGESMVTELIYWSDFYTSIISPFYNYDTGKTAATTRSNRITCRDIDGDGNIEIPISVKKKQSPQLGIENWKSYKNTVLNHKTYSCSCLRDRFIIVLSDKIYPQLAFEYNETNRELKAFSKSDKQECFRIITVIASEYDESRYPGYSQIYKSSGFVYLASVKSNSKVSVSIDDLKSMIKSY